MPSIDGASLNGLLSTPPVLGALAALLLVLVVLAVMRAGLARRLLLPVLLIVAFGAGVVAILDRLAQDEQAAERRALAQRYAELSAQALAPGSPLGCLDGVAGDAVETACEKTVFVGPQATASAVAYMAARLRLLADAAAYAHGDPEFAARIAGLRRSIELDRFGIAAHVLAARDGCIADRCAAFALFNDTSVIKANLKAQVFDQYVSRYAADWNKSPPVALKEAPDVPVASAGASEAPAKAPVPDRYDFPSAASIPPVNIMTPEPPLPKEARDAQAAQPTGEVRVPPKRPPAETPPAR